MCGRAKRFHAARRAQPAKQPSIPMNRGLSVSPYVHCPPRNLGARAAGGQRKAWGVSPRATCRIRSSPRERAKVARLRGVARIHGLLITATLTPGADALGFMLHACFAGSKTEVALRAAPGPRPFHLPRAREAGDITKPAKRAGSVKPRASALGPRPFDLQRAREAGDRDCEAGERDCESHVSFVVFDSVGFQERNELVAKRNLPMMLLLSRQIPLNHFHM